MFANTASVLTTFILLLSVPLSASAGAVPNAHTNIHARRHAVPVLPRGDLTEDMKAGLSAQNDPRTAKNLVALQWDAGLAKDAQQWADHLAQIGQMVHSDGSQRTNQGENLYWSSGDDTPFADAAKAWMEEVRDYHGEPIGQGDFEKYGHYTQCMWKSTKKVGMAQAKDSNGGVYVVGRYSEPGNMMGETPY